MKILFFDPSNKYESLHDLLKGAGYASFYHLRLENVEQEFPGDPPDVIIFTSDFQASTSMGLLQQLRQNLPRTSTLIVTANTDSRFLVSFMKLGIRQTFPGKLPVHELFTRIERQLIKISEGANFSEESKFSPKERFFRPSPRFEKGENRVDSTNRGESPLDSPYGQTLPGDSGTPGLAAQKLLEENIAIREELDRRKKDLDDREAYLEECENYLMEKGENLTLKEAELDQKEADLAQSASQR